MKSTGRLVAGLIAIVCVQGCGRSTLSLHESSSQPGKGTGAQQDPTLPTSPPVPPAHDKVFDALPQGPTASLAASVCIPPIGNDGVNQVFCKAGGPPPIKSLKDLLNALGLGFANPSGGNGTGGNAGFALTGHSSSLVAHQVSSLNPRAIIFTPGFTAGKVFNVVGFTRGEEFAEILTADPGGQVNSYILHFKKACDLTNSCTWADLLTPEIEQNWVDYSLYEDDNRKELVGNTVMDCQQCHQPKGPGQNPLLRMQEFTTPFTHFMWMQSEGGKALFSDYYTAHAPTEDYGGIPAALIGKADPSLLASFITAAGAPAQGNAFPSATIEAEVKASSPQQPILNLLPGTSATWQGLYDAFVQGLFIPPPYHDVKVTDPAKLATMGLVYKEVMSGKLPGSMMPDIRRVFPDDPKVLADLGFRIKPGLTDGHAILVNACMQCHTSTLDQGLSRAKFNVQTITQMTKVELQLAITRIQLPADDLASMPPQRFRELLAPEKQLLIDYLKGLLPAAP